MKVILIALFYFGASILLCLPVWRSFWEMRKGILLTRVLAIVMMSLWITLIGMGVSVLIGVIKIR